MQKHEIEKIVRNYYDYLSKGNLDGVLSLFAPEGEFKMPGGDQEVMRGISEIRPMMQSWIKAFPDMQEKVISLKSYDDGCVAEVKVMGTHKGPLEGPNGVIQATNKKIDVPACEVFTIRNGKIVSLSCYFLDSLFFKQIGVEPQKMAA